MGLFGWEKVSRDDPVYLACLAGTTATGTAIGSAMGSMTLPGIGTVAGFGWGTALGFVAGYLTCPYLAPSIKRKLEIEDVLSEAELSSAAEAMSQYANVSQAEEALRLIAIVRSAGFQGKSRPICESPPEMARSLLAAYGSSPTSASI